MTDPVKPSKKPQVVTGGIIKPVYGIEDEEAAFSLADIFIGTTQAAVRYKTTVAAIEYKTTVAVLRYKTTQRV